MNAKSSRILWFAAAAVILLMICAGSVSAQEVLLDKMEKCADLICYPSIDDPNQYYYLPDQPALAYKNGKPQFSFLKYARTQATGEAGTGRAEGGGIVHFLVTYGASDARIRAAQKDLQGRHPDAVIIGPIVYRKGNFALITSFQEDNTLTTRTVAVGKAPLMEGQKTAVSIALTREGAELLWESFKSDTPDISLVFDMEFAGIREPYEATLEADWSQISKHDRLKAGVKYAWFGADVDILFQELRQTGAIKITTKGDNAVMDTILQSANEKLLKVMFDPAPVDDLTRAAAEKNSYDSLNQAAKLLKDAATTKSSSSSTKTKSSNFLEPSPADRKARFFASLFNALFTESCAQAAEQTSAEDIENQPIRKATKELTTKADEAFNKKQYEEALRLYKAAVETYNKSVNQRQEGRGTLRCCIGDCLMQLERYAEAVQWYTEAADIYGHDTEAGKDMLQRRAKAEKLAGSELPPLPADPDAYPNTVEDKGTDSKNKGTQAEVPSTSASEAYNNARRLYEEARKGGFQTDATQKALGAYLEYEAQYAPTGSRAEEVKGRIRMLEERLNKNNASDGSDASNTGSKPSGDSKAEESFELPPPPPPPASESSESKTPATATPSSGSPSVATTPAANTASAAKTSTPKAAATAQKSRADGAPGFSLVASYSMKRIKRSGKMVYNMNHYRTETQAFAMAENIGDIYKRYGNDDQIFRAVTIDDPVFKQREILVTLDGQDADTFTKYLNFVTVKMRKRHQSGDTTTDEIVITPETFQSSNNNFSMVYGWKNDSDRTAWLGYEYQAVWSFHGGVEIRTPWQQTDTPMLALTPPHRYRSVSIEGDGTALTDAGVRHAVVTFTCRIGDEYLSRQTTIRNNSTAPAMIVDVPEDVQSPETKVDITWYMKKGRQVSAEEFTLESDIVYWDELPEGGA